ncbi:hypothetical protein ACOMHN_067168 [Nucella lapillus]
MKARQRKPQTEKNQRTGSHRFKQSRKDRHGLAAKGVANRRGRPARGSLSGRPDQRHGVILNHLGSDNHHRWGATDFDRPSGSGWREGWGSQHHRQSGHDPWQFQQAGAAGVRGGHWRSSSFRGRGGGSSSSGWLSFSQESSEQQGGGSQPFRFGQQGRGQKPFGRGGGRGGRGRRRNQPQKDQGQAQPQRDQGQAQPQRGQGQTQPQRGQGQTQPQRSQGQTQRQKSQEQTEPQGGQGQTQSQRGQGKTQPQRGQGQTQPQGGQGQTQPQRGRRQRKLQRGQGRIKPQKGQLQRNQRQTQHHEELLKRQAPELGQTESKLLNHRLRQRLRFCTETIRYQGERPKATPSHILVTSARLRPKSPSVDELISEAVEKFLNLESNNPAGTGGLLQQTTSGEKPLQQPTTSQPSPSEAAIRKKAKASRWDILSRTATASVADSTRKPEGSESRRKASRWDIPSRTASLSAAEIYELGKRASRWDDATETATLSVADSSKELEDSKSSKKASHRDILSRTATLSLAEEWEPSKGASHLEVSSGKATLNLAGGTKEPEDSELCKAEDQHSEPFVDCLGGLKSFDPQVEILRATEQFLLLTRLSPTPAVEPAVVTPAPLQVTGSSEGGLDSPGYRGKSEKNSSAGDSQKKELKFVGDSSAAKTSTVPEQEQEETGRVTDPCLKTDDDVDLELAVQPPYSQKSGENKLQLPQFTDQIETSILSQPSDLQKTQSAESFQAQATYKTPNDSGITSRHTDAEKEKLVRGAREGLHQLSPSQKRNTSSSSLKGNSPAELGPFQRTSSLEPTSGRRIVKVKPRHHSSGSESEKRNTKSGLASTTPISDSSHRRVIKVKSCNKSFKAILSHSFSEDQESGTLPLVDTENDTHGQDFRCASAELDSESETASVTHDGDKTLSHTVADNLQARDFDFSSFFPRSRTEEKNSIDLLAHRCESVTLSSTQTGDQTRYWGCDNQTQDGYSYLNHHRQFGDSAQCLEQRFEGGKGLSDSEFGSHYYDEEADQWEDLSDTADDYGCHSTEVDSYDLSQTEEFESDIEKELDPMTVSPTSCSVSESVEKSQQEESRQTERGLPFVKKAKKGGLTIFNERDKLKALFSVRKKGSLKLTARALSSGAGEILGTPEKDRCLEAGQPHDAPPGAGNIVDMKDTKADCRISHEKQTNASTKLTAEAAFTEQNLPIVASMSGPTLHIEYVPPVSKDSEQCDMSNLERTESADLGQSDQKDPFLTEIQQTSHTHRQRNASSDFSDIAEQSYQSDIVIDDDEILREIDSCLEIQRPVHEEKTASVCGVESKSSVSSKNDVDISDAARGSALAETNSTHVRENPETSSQSVLDTATSSQTESSNEEKWISQRHFDKEPSSHIPIDDSCSLSAAVSGLKVQDRCETCPPESIGSGPASLTHDGTPSGFHPYITFSVNTMSSEAVPAPDQQSESHGRAPTSATAKTSGVTGKQQMMEKDRRCCEIVPTIFSQPALGNNALRSCLRLEQDPSGTTDINIFMDITGNNSNLVGKEVDGNSSSGSVALQTNESETCTATAQAEQCGLGEAHSPSEEEFVTTYISLVVPRNKALEINFQPMMNSGISPEDKSIEIEVTADTGCPEEDVAPAERASSVGVSANDTEENSSPTLEMDLAAAGSGMKSPTTACSHTASAKMIDVDSFDLCEEESSEMRDTDQEDGASVATAALKSSLEDRSEEGNATVETGTRQQRVLFAASERVDQSQEVPSALTPAGSEPQTAPSLSSEVAVGGREEMTCVDHYPTSPPSLTHCSQFEDEDYPPNTSSPPHLKPQTLLPASDQHQPISSPPGENLLDSEADLPTESSAVEPMEIGDVASQDKADVTPNPSLVSSVDDCVSPLVANPVVSQTVECGRGICSRLVGDDDDVDVSEDSRSARKRSSTADLFSAASTAAAIVMPAHVFKSATQDMTELDVAYSDEDENKSPESDDDSDDSLGDEPEFLTSVIGGSIPLSTVNTNVPVQSGQGRAGESSGQSHCRASTFSLDSLLRQTKKDEAEERETVKLRKELLSGDSFSQEENENDEMDFDDFTDEQKHTLRTLRLEEQEIQDSAPGEDVLRDEPLGHLFTETLPPAACEVHVATPPCLSQLLDHYHPGTLMDILSSDIISLTYHSLPCKSEIQRWLFFIMSIHPSVVEVQQCGDQLHQVLQWQMGNQRLKHTWTPPLLDLLRVFVNWGADLKDLVFDTSAIDYHQLEENLPLVPSGPAQGAPPPCSRNFEPVLRMLVSWLQARPGYSTGELNQLLLMLCRLSLDHSLCKTFILTELQVCLASVLDSYQPSEWNSVVPWLCRKLSALSSHHHNQVYLTQLLSSVCPRSRYLQQRLAYLLLHSALTSQHLADAHIHRFQLGDLLGLIPELKRKLRTDNYQVASLVRLLDLSVGPAAHHLSQKKQLFQLLEAVRLIVSEIRDSMQRLDCTKVKDMLLHLCLKWDLAVKANNIKQRKIFSCFSSSTPVHIEQLEVKDDYSSNEEDGASPEVKIPKRDGSCEDVKSPKDRCNTTHTHDKDGGDSRTGLSESALSSSDLCSDGQDRLGIFVTLKRDKTEDRNPPAGCDGERWAVVSTPRQGNVDSQGLHGTRECVQPDVGPSRKSSDTDTSGTASVHRTSTPPPAAEKSTGSDWDRPTVLDTERSDVSDPSPDRADFDSDDSLPEL